LLGELEASDRFVIADLEAGTGTVLRLQRGDVDVAVVVTQPTAKAISIAALAAETAHRRGARVIVVANRVATEEDFSRIGGGLADHEIVRCASAGCARRPSVGTGASSERLAKLCC
jgi:CO dehydrogenase nickel-insertion accessory protein CooC1